MKNKNLLDGVKTIYIAEIIMLIATAVAFIMETSVSLIDNNVFELSDIEKVGLYLVFAIFLIAAQMLIYASYIMMLVGISRAVKGDSVFKYALIESVILLVFETMALILLLTETKMANQISRIVCIITELFMNLFVIFGITHLSKTPYNTEIERTGRRLTYQIIVFYFLIILIYLANIFLIKMKASALFEIVIIALNVVCSLMVCILYLKFLKQAKEALIN